MPYMEQMRMTRRARAKNWARRHDNALVVAGIVAAPFVGGAIVEAGVWAMNWSLALNWAAVVLIAGVAALAVIVVLWGIECAGLNDDDRENERWRN